MDATDHDSRIGSLLLLKKGGQKTVRTKEALDPLFALLHTVNNDVTYNKSLLLQNHFIQVATHWWKGVFPDFNILCIF